MNDFIVDVMVYFDKREREKSGVFDSCIISVEMFC